MSARLNRFSFFLLLIGDIITLYAALFLMLVLRYGQEFSPQLIKDHATPFSVIFIGWLVILYALGFYDRRLHPNRSQTVIALVQALFLSAIFAIGYFYFLPTITPKRNLILTLIVFGILFYIWRNLATRFIVQGPFRARVALLGQGEKMKQVEQILRHNPNLGFDLTDIRGKLSDPHQIKQQLEIYKPDIIVTSANPQGLSVFLSRLGVFTTYQPLYIPLADFLETIEGKVQIEITDATSLIETLTQPRPAYETLSRLNDLLLAIIGGALTLIVFLPVALVIKLNDGGPIFYRQIRIGRGGHRFMIFKFRTMVREAETSGPQWTEENDRRITAVGRYLRRTYIDELPQFINILKGEMSVVGPRPERPEFVKTLSEKIPFYNFRHLARPGVTGWAQLNYPYARSIKDSIEKTKYDLYYIKHRSILLDWAIILQTLRVIFGHNTKIH